MKNEDLSPQKSVTLPKLNKCSPRRILSKFVDQQIEKQTKSSAFQCKELNKSGAESSQGGNDNPETKLKLERKSLT